MKVDLQVKVSDVFSMDDSKMVSIYCIIMAVYKKSGISTLEPLTVPKDIPAAYDQSLYTFDHSKP